MTSDAQRERWRKNSARRRAEQPELVRAQNRAANARSRAADPEHHKDKMLRWHYGITLEQFEALIVAQNHLCSVCGCDLRTILPRHRHLDHDHETGKVRAVLCHGCNTGLGALKHDPAVMRAAIAYLERQKQ